MKCRLGLRNDIQYAYTNVGVVESLFLCLEQSNRDKMPVYRRDKKAKRRASDTDPENDLCSDNVIC